MLDKLDGRVPAQDGKFCIENYIICPVTKTKITSERIIFRRGAGPGQIGFDVDELASGRQ